MPKEITLGRPITRQQRRAEARRLATVLQPSEKQQIMVTEGVVLNQLYPQVQLQGKILSVLIGTVKRLAPDEEAFELAWKDSYDELKKLEEQEEQEEVREERVN